ncbi:MULTISPECIES: DUF6636 domain-containing protein [unclassified Beijerinckia]|uniref:DUF6636 domain-containing protein n=1 Tax=unclassified Beijerinckia TaxID=2638183 RepID=UPI00089A8B3A|nr:MULTISPECIES: DUF6636 domain-containing protein [unclassified Beijerinckia]MDH7797266.1 hypothetical protein [Beijerinckia sp. GAS462]SEC78651.1 hypothetical protein SAMN05443249_3559 [Beijerinckia sp. 28-YEA-48]
MRGTLALAKVLAAVLLGLASISAAQALEGDSFRSPSSNIHCAYFADTDGASLRCDIRQTSNKPPPRPRECDLDWGNAFEVLAKSTRGARICHGDTVADPNLPVLSYGAVWSRGGFTCHSAETGILCRNARGAGFELSRAQQRVF